MLAICLSILFFDIVHLFILQQSSSVDESYSFPLIFEKLPEVNQEGSQWTDCETRDAINLIYQNVDRLNAYLAAIVRVPYRLIMR